MENPEKIKQILIDNISELYSNEEIFALGRHIGVSKCEFFCDKFTKKELAEKFITVVYEHEKQEELRALIENNPQYYRKKIVERLNSNSKLEKDADILLASNIFSEIEWETSELIGREEELTTLKSIISSGKRLILINGIGGIGKTTLSQSLFKEYIFQNKDNEESEFNYFIYLKFDNSINNTILKVASCPEMNMEEKIKYSWDTIKKINKEKRVILFIDNVTNSIKDDLSIERLYRLDCTIVMTSRLNDIENFEKFTLDVMDFERCKKVFIKNYCGEGRFLCSDEELILRKIINELAARHTLTIEIFAKIAKEYSWSIENLYSRLNENGFRIRIDEYGVSLEEEYKKLFAISNLNDKEMNILEAFSIFPYKGLDGDVCHRWLDKDIGMQSDAHKYFYNLYIKGWLQCQKNSYMMHPVISHVLRNMQKISLSNHKYLIKKCIQTKGINSQQMLLYLPFIENIVRYFYDENSEEIARACQKLGDIFRVHEQYSKAIDYYTRAICIYKKLQNEEVVYVLQDIAVVCNDIAVVYNSLGLSSKSLSYLKEAKDICNDSSLIATIHHNMAIAYKIQDGEEYKEYLLKSIKETRCTSKKNCVDLAKSIMMLGQIQENSADAFEKYIEALTVIDKVGECFERGQIYNAIGTEYYKIDRYDKSREYSKKAIKIINKLMGETHSELKISYSNIALSYYQEKVYSKAIENFIKVINILDLHDKKLTEEKLCVYIVLIKSYRFNNQFSVANKKCDRVLKMYENSKEKSKESEELMKQIRELKTDNN